ncbi:hypothetical protein MBM_03088 [Drepanopeziza brunnea f. sp. 'multigermtubi' MB_m1]|uniref:Uncharacterized protein n=1 Tax=Marssonina brunnea f. sp. multigermtubi (strain MB_m1) TaxID=1072389 RepID=K1X0W1_MARBU|nr:uncharacterized protein MBM_03088 [Drepanopeziza brunnea f. sp. 'multigermtubi' MB_m1]EKD18846.1 hypothetical protein MBM_03088 [Drepanopeziza brunnea f. sp. 'multigermtubi' MB_m1]
MVCASLNRRADASPFVTRLPAPCLTCNPNGTRGPHPWWFVAGEHTAGSEPSPICSSPEEGRKMQPCFSYGSRDQSDASRCRLMDARLRRRRALGLQALTVDVERAERRMALGSGRRSRSIVGSSTKPCLRGGIWPKPRERPGKARGISSLICTARYATQLGRSRKLQRHRASGSRYFGAVPEQRTRRDVASGYRGVPVSRRQKDGRVKGDSLVPTSRAQLNQPISNHHLPPLEQKFRQLALNILVVFPCFVCAPQDVHGSSFRVDGESNEAGQEAVLGRRDAKSVYEFQRVFVIWIVKDVAESILDVENGHVTVGSENIPVN